MSRCTTSNGFISPSRQFPGPWAPKWCVPGEGVVDTIGFFKFLKSIDFKGPFEFIMEYDLYTGRNNKPYNTLGQDDPGGNAYGKWKLEVPREQFVGANEARRCYYKAQLREAQLIRSLALNRRKSYEDLLRSMTYYLAPAAAGVLFLPFCCPRPRPASRDSSRDNPGTPPRKAFPTRGPVKKRLLFLADTRTGYQHDYISHAMATIERLGPESGAYVTLFKTDTQLVTKQAISNGNARPSITLTPSFSPRAVKAK